MTDCKLCQQEIKGIMLTCTKGSLCPKCSEDIGNAEYQPAMSLSSILWCLAETFFRKGKGEEINFEQVWNENDNLQLIKFRDLFSKFEGK
jgi:hypothetical protein